MKNKVIYSINAKEMYISCSLINVYNSQIFGNYINYIEKTKIDQHCIIITLVGTAKVYHRDGQITMLSPHSIYFTNLYNIEKMTSNVPQWHALFYWFVPQNINLPNNQKFELQNLDIKNEIDDCNKIINLMKMQLANKLQLANAFFCFKLCSYLENINVQFNKTITTVDKIIMYINEHIDDNIEVADIATEFNYSEKHIHHLFVTTLDISPKQFITNIRLQKVCFLLKTTNLTLQNIADRMNFSTPSHLANSFKAHFGISPATYRNANKDLLLPKPSK